MLFDINNKQLIKSCRPILHKLYKEHKRTYIRLFFFEEDVRFNEFDLSPLIETGIIKKIHYKFRANVQVFPLSGKYICTDFNYSAHRKIKNTYLTDKHGVWGILPEETPILAKKAIVKKDDIVLDLATGSGMIGIFCADNAKRVIATDINPRTINYGQFNAILNNVEEKIEFRMGDLFAPVKGLKFDLIIWNGPTVAVPETNGKYPIYSDGGMDGAGFTKRFIDEAFTYLKPQGRLQWYDCAVGTINSPVSLDYLKSKWVNRKIKIFFKSLTSTPVSLQKSFDIYAKYNLGENKKTSQSNKDEVFKTPLSCKPVTLAEENRWHKWLKQKSYTHFYYAWVEVYPNEKFELKMEFPKQDIRTDRYLTRYWLWMSYPLIVKKLKICETY